MDDQRKTKKKAKQSRARERREKESGAGDVSSRDLRTARAHEGEETHREAKKVERKAHTL